LQAHSRHWSDHPTARARAIIALSASVLGAGCTILAGIQEGHLGTHADSGAPPDDAAAETALGSASDAKPDSSPPPPGDSAVDAPSAPPRVVCSPVGNSVIDVDDSANYVGDGSGAPGFQGVWLGKTTITDQMFLYTQLASDTSKFLEYQVDFGTHNVTFGLPWGGDGTAIQLMDVASVPVGANGMINTALATSPAFIAGAPPGERIKVIPLRSFYGAQAWAQPLVSSPLVAKIQSATFLVAPDASSATWLVSAQGLSMSRYAIFAGYADTADAAVASPALALSNTTKFFVGNAPFFDMGGALHAFVSGVDPDGGASAYTMAEGLADAGTIVPSTSIPGSTGGRVVAARPSTTTASKALVVTLVPDATGTKQHAYGGLVDPSQLSSLAIGTPPFDRSDVIGSDVVPIFFQSGVGWMDDETAIFGPGPTGTGLYLVWLGADGHAVFSNQSGTPLFDDGLSAVSSAVQFGQHVGEKGGTLYVAWLETLDSAGDQSIKALKLACSPVSP
jgi:hypothetical protein